MVMSKIPLPVDLNELSDRPKPGPIGKTTGDYAKAIGDPLGLANYIPRKNRLDDSMTKAVEEINSARREPPPIPPSIANLEHVTNELGSLLKASAESMVTEAQNLLEQTKLWITNLNMEINVKMQEHAALTERLQIFGKDVLEAHKRYHGEPK